MFWMSHYLIWVKFAYYLVNTIIHIVPCRPIAKAWNLLIEEGKCVDIFSLDIASAAINAISDLAILVLPQLNIWNLQMTLRQKVQVSLVLLVGIL